MRSNLDCGYALEDPPITVPWGLSRRKLAQILGGHGLRRWDNDNFVISCKSLTGLSHELQFRFNVDYGPNHYMLVLYQLPGHDIGQSFHTFQRHLELTFGSPSSSEDTDDSFPYYTWKIGDFTVSHGVHERFVLCETVSIAPPSYSPPLPVRCWRTLAYWFSIESFLIPRLVLLSLIPVLVAIYLLSR